MPVRLQRVFLPSQQQQLNSEEACPGGNMCSAGHTHHYTRTSFHVATQIPVDWRPRATDSHDEGLQNRSLHETRHFGHLGHRGHSGQASQAVPTIGGMIIGTAGFTVTDSGQQVSERYASSSYPHGPHHALRLATQVSQTWAYSHLYSCHRSQQLLGNPC